MITYTALSGETLSGDVWAPGPLPRTAWVLDPDVPGGARVVDYGSMTERAWEPSAPKKAPRPKVQTFADLMAEQLGQYAEPEPTLFAI